MHSELSAQQNNRMLFTFIYHPAADPAIYHDKTFQSCFPVFSTVCLQLATHSSSTILSVFISRLKTSKYSGFHWTLIWPAASATEVTTIWRYTNLVVVVNASRLKLRQHRVLVYLFVLTRPSVVDYFWECFNWRAAVTSNCGVMWCVVLVGRTLDSRGRSSQTVWCCSWRIWTNLPIGASEYILFWRGYLPWNLNCHPITVVF